MSRNGPVTQNDRRLLMLGLDAVSLPFIRENIGQLPVLASFLESGTLRELQSPATYLSASVWPTFSTGKQPGEHGQYFPFQWSGRDQRYRRVADPCWSEQFDCEPFWHVVAKAGVPTIAFDIAHALHDERAPCVQITNWSYQSSGDAKASHPELLREIKRRFGRRPIGPEVPVPKNARQCAAIRNQLIAAVRAKADATLYLMQQPWRLFVTGWYEAHRAGHNLWAVEGDFGSEAATSAMLDVYRETDRQLGRILAEVERQGSCTSVLVFALHGMEPNRAQDHFLTEVLWRLNNLYLGRETTGTNKPAAQNATASLRHMLPSSLQYWAASLLGEGVQDWVVNRALTGGRDWQATPSFPVLSGGEGLIRLNLKGRETNGFFDRGSAELNHYVEWLKERLSAIEVCCTGERLIDKIVVVDDTFSGVRRDFLPDLILDWRPTAPVHRIRSADIGEIEVSLATGRGGNHNDRAFAIAKGDEIFRDLVTDTDNIAGIGEIARKLLIPAP